MISAGYLTLAFVPSHDPNHEGTWGNFFGLVMVVLGVVVFVFGAWLWRLGWADARKAGKLLGFLSIVGIPILVGGALAALGVWVF